MYQLYNVIKLIFIIINLNSTLCFNFVTSRRSLITNTLLLANTNYNNRHSKILLNETSDKINNNILSLGFDIETGGHIFQLHLSNSQYMIASEYINNTVGAWSKGDIFFGFNISRVFKTDY